jgi:hypothetical protein
MVLKPMSALRNAGLSLSKVDRSGLSKQLPGKSRPDFEAPFPGLI